jgi:hypothetical protein
LRVAAATDGRHGVLTPDGKHLLVVSKTEPIIDKYSLAGKRVARLELASHPMFKNNLAELASKRAAKTNKNTQLNLFTGLACTNNLLLVIYVDQTDTKPLPCRLLLVNHTDSEMRIMQVFNLCGQGAKLRSYGGLSIDTEGKSFLIQEGASGKLQLFDLARSEQ